ncbi:MAG: Guanylate cyclase protein [Candidatus Brocadiaceae bacterium]|nr:Guanylate cyclase protein [Candidatus Brocadiaceae bacterium]
MITPNDTPDNMPEYGVLALVDIVNYTGQTARLGDYAASQFTQHFQKEARAIIERQGFTVLKFLGDAVLFWGTVAQIGNFVDAILDFFVRKCIPGKHGFEAKLRMVAHVSCFTLVYNDKREAVDIMGSDAIMTFRLEKKAQVEEVIVTDALFKDIEALLRKTSFMTFQEPSTEPLKGLEIFGNPLCYRLIPPCFDDNKKTYTIADVYRQKRESLFDKVRQIPIFANLYPPIDMDENFINLSLHKDWKVREAKKGREEARFSKHTEMFRDYLEQREEMDARVSAGSAINARKLFHRFNKGIILGLPGAGKTTILQHFAYTCLSGDRDALLLLVNCRDIPVNKPVPEAISLDEALRILVRAFLYPGSPCNADEEKRHVEYTSSKFKEAWNARKAVILIDALDESQTPDITDMLLRITASLMGNIETAERDCVNEAAESQEDASENRVFLSSRPGEFPTMHPLDEPVFYVQPITMEDMRDMARNFYGEASEVYKRFDDAIWRHSWIKRLAGTPLTTLLLLVYFQTRGQFNRRFPTYDLLLKFVLNQTWEKLKRGDYKKSLLNPGYFIEEADKDDFLEKIGSQYDMLSLLSYESLYGSEMAQTEEAVTTKRSLSKTELKQHFLDWLERKDKRDLAWLNGLDEGEIRKKTDTWLDIFKKEHLLISAGYDRYLFIHSTVMEFLAARYLQTQLGKEDKQILRKEIEAMIGTRERQGLETLPMCCGRDYNDGFLLLSLLKDHFQQSPPFSLKNPLQGDKEVAHAISSIPFRCLAETEAAEKASLDALTITRLRNAAENVLTLDTKGYSQHDKNFSYYQGFTGKSLTGFYGSPNLKHQGGVFKAVYAPDGKTILSASSDNTVKMWDTETGKEIRAFTGHTSRVWSAVYAPDGKTILSASFDNTVKMWDTETGKERATIRLLWKPLKLSSSPTSPHVFITANANGTITAFDLSKLP